MSVKELIEEIHALEDSLMAQNGRRWKTAFDSGSYDLANRYTLVAHQITDAISMLRQTAYIQEEVERGHEIDYVEVSRKKLAIAS
jgi:hypothetical protein